MKACQKDDVYQTEINFNLTLGTHYLGALPISFNSVNIGGNC